MSKELGLIFKTLRKKCGLTQRQVAEALHLDRSTYAYYEGGTTEPDLKGLKKLSDIFNVDPSVLLPDEDGTFSLRVHDVTQPEGEGEQHQTPVVEVGLPDDKIYELSKEEKTLLVMFRVLGITDKDRILTYVREVLDESDK